MSATTQKTMYASFVAGSPGADELIDWGFQKLAADPAAPAEGVIWQNTTDNALKARINGATVTLATLDDLPTNAMQFKGGHDASTGVPAAAVDVGDVYVVTTAGTIAGVDGNDVLEVGDLLVAKTASAAGAAVGANFVAVESNQDFSGKSGLSEVTGQAVTADTVTTVIMPGLTTVYGYDIYNGASNITDSLVTTVAGNQVTMRSSVALTGLTVRAYGAN